MPTPIENTSYLYRPVLKQAWKTVSKFKSLWFFGLFALLVSAGGEYEIIVRGIYNPQSDGIINSFLMSFQQGWQEGLALTQGNLWGNLWNLLVTDYGQLALTLFALLLIIVLTLVVIFLVVVCEIALIKGASLAGKNKKMSIREGINFSHHNFWPVFGVVAILKAVIFAIFSLLSLELWLLSGLGSWGNLLYILSFILFVAIVLIVSFVLKYQRFYLILRKEKFGQSLRSAWQLFIKNWLISIEMALIMLGVYLVATFLWFFIVLILAGIPIIIIPFYLAVLPALFKVLISVLAAVLALASVFLITAIMTAFQWSGWVALFERLDTGEKASKLERFTQQAKEIPKMFLDN